MLANASYRAVIIGHSEGRRFFGETGELANKKVKAALTAGLAPILCVGGDSGRARGRKDGRDTRPTISLWVCRFGGQGLVMHPSCLRTGLGHRHRPTAEREIAGEVHGFLRRRAAKALADQASALRILYGGSVRPDNIKRSMAQEEIDGALVGARV